MEDRYRVTCGKLRVRCNRCMTAYICPMKTGSLLDMPPCPKCKFEWPRWELLLMQKKMEEESINAIPDAMRLPQTVRDYQPQPAVVAG